MNIVAVCDKKTCTWLKLAGIGETHIIDDITTSEEILSSLWLREDISVIIITSEVASSCKDFITQKMVEKVFPVIIELTTTDKKGEDPLKELLKQTVGMELEI